MSFDVDVKRFYVPGAIVGTHCPKCGSEVKRDFGDDYLSYPKANEPIDVHMYCRSCDDVQPHEFTIKIVLWIAIEVVS